MSFSPEIESSHMQIMNVFTRYNGGEPFKSYDQFLAANFIPSPVNFRSTPLRFPTLYSFGNGNDVPYAEAIRSIDADYLVYCIRGTVTELPNLPSAADRSGFLAWDEGFLSTLMSRVWAYRNGAAGVDDEWIQEYKLGDTSDNWYYSNYLSRSNTSDSSCGISTIFSNDSSIRNSNRHTSCWYRNGIQ